MLVAVEVSIEVELVVFVLVDELSSVVGASDVVWLVLVSIETVVVSVIVEISLEVVDEMLVELSVEVELLVSMLVEA